MAENKGLLVGAAALALAGGTAIGDGGGDPTGLTAAFDASTSGLTVHADASASQPPAGGEIVGYQWEFGDGAQATGRTAEHEYASAGTYTVTLTVVTAGSETATATNTVHPTGDGGGSQEPSAAFAVETNGMTANVDASPTSDPDGDVQSYEWAFGVPNGEEVRSGRTATYTWETPGTYHVALTVTDAAGNMDLETKSVTVEETGGDPSPTPTPNQSPSAHLTTHTDGLTVHVDGRGSSDPDGQVNSYFWQFGDGAVGREPRMSHTFGGEGTYDVSLTVTDDDGAQDTMTQQVNVTRHDGGTPGPAPNQPPAASFTHSRNGDRVTFDASGSTDADGSITSYRWSFGDGTSGSGQRVSHTYAASGTYTVTLTVTDDDGATDRMSTAINIVIGVF